MAEGRKEFFILEVLRFTPVKQWEGLDLRLAAPLFTDWDFHLLQHLYGQE